MSEVQVREAARGHAERHVDLVDRDDRREGVLRGNAASFYAFG